MLKLFANGGYVPVQVGKFPAGEVYVKVENVQQVVYPHRRVSIEWQFQGSDSVIELAMLTNALYEACGDLQITLYCPYFPGARQDRVVEEGEAFGLRVYADIIKALGFKKIITEDLHSDVLPSMLPPQMLCNKKQHELWEGGAFTLLAGGVLVDNGDNSVYGINPVEFWNTHERN